MKNCHPSQRHKRPQVESEALFWCCVLYRAPNKDSSRYGVDYSEGTMAHTSRAALQFCPSKDTIMGICATVPCKRTYPVVMSSPVTEDLDSFTI